MRRGSDSTPLMAPLTFRGRAAAERQIKAPGREDGLAAFLGIDVAAMRWHDDGLCAQTDPEAFFPEKGGSTKEARRVCQACPVRLKCLFDAMERDDNDFGILGGHTARERRKMRTVTTSPGLFPAGAGLDDDLDEDATADREAAA
jgi:WhiB family transcriptional regulator, redox-sensing transcriptional regulator